MYLFPRSLKASAVECVFLTIWVDASYHANLCQAMAWLCVCYSCFLKKGQTDTFSSCRSLEMCNIIGLVGLITKVKREVDQRSETKAETRSCTKPIYLEKPSEIFRFSSKWKVFPFTKMRELQELFVFCWISVKQCGVNKPFEIL